MQESVLPSGVVHVLTGYALKYVSEVTVYDVIGEDPVLRGALHVTVACPFPAVANAAVGAPGTVPTWATRVAADAVLPLIGTTTAVSESVELTTARISARRVFITGVTPWLRSAYTLTATLPQDF